MTHGAKTCTKIVQRDRTAVADPDLEITGGEAGGGAKKFFSALRFSIWPINKGDPGPLP